MPSLQLLNMFGRQLTRMSIVTSVPISFSLVGLQAVMDVKFSCPCKAGWNRDISAFVFCAPALFAIVIMFALLRPFQYKRSCCQKQNNSEISQGQDNSEISQGQDKSKISQKKVYLACLIPCLVWICLCLIDGDYIACGLTNWNGRYACDKELHPNCFNWCKPTELSPEINETECYERTRKWIYESKITGYILAVIFCFLAIILLCLGTSAETKTEDGSSPTIIQMRNTESADEAARLLSDTPAETETVTKVGASPTIIQMTNTEYATEEASLLRTEDRKPL